MERCRSSQRQQATMRRRKDKVSVHLSLCNGVVIHHGLEAQTGLASVVHKGVQAVQDLRPICVSTRRREHANSNAKHILRLGSLMIDTAWWHVYSLELATSESPHRAWIAGTEGCKTGGGGICQELQDSLWCGSAMLRDEVIHDLLILSAQDLTAS